MNDTDLFEAVRDALVEDGFRPADQRRGLAHAMLDVVKPEFQRLEAERDAGYHDRAQILAWATSLPGVRAVVTPAVDVDEPGWLLLYIDTWAGQLSWHIAPGDAHLFWQVEHVKAGDPRARWDGHTTDEKHRRMGRITGADKLKP